MTSSVPLAVVAVGGAAERRGIEAGACNINSVTGAPNEDCRVTAHFGSCHDGRVNGIPTTPGGIIAVRMFGPRPEILDGRWTFPNIKPTT